MLISASAGSSDSNTVTTPAINTTGAVAVIAAVAGLNAPDASFFTDSASNLWSGTQAVGSIGTSPSLALFVLNGPTTSASYTFTYTKSGEYPSVALIAVSGSVTLVGGHPYDQVNNTGNVSSGTSAQPGSITPGSGNELIITGLAVNPAVSALSINSSFTIAQTVAFASGAHWGISIGWLIQGSSPAAVNPTWSWTTAVAAQSVVISMAGSFSAGAPTGSQGISRMPFRLGVAAAAPWFVADRLGRNKVIRRRQIWRPDKW